MHSDIELVDSQGKVIKGKVIAVFSNGDVRYVAYTIINNGKEELLASRYITVDGKYKLEPIYDDNEWDFIDNYLEENVFLGDENGE